VRTTTLTKVQLAEKNKSYFIWHKVLGGLLKWKEVVKTDSLGTELHIITDRQPDKIFLNGHPIHLKARIKQ